MLRCAPDDRETIDVIRTDLSEIVVSITRETNALERSRDLAHIRRDDSAPSLQAPSNISFDEEPRYLTIESPSTFTGDGGESALMMRTRPRRVGFEAGEPSRGDHNTASTTDEQYVSKVPVANSMKTTLRDESKDQSSERVPGSNYIEASRKTAADSHVANQTWWTTRTNRSKYHIGHKGIELSPLKLLDPKVCGRPAFDNERIDQKSNTWFQVTLGRLEHMLERTNRQTTFAR
jgi:hypothetical protein